MICLGTVPYKGYKVVCKISTNASRAHNLVTLQPSKHYNLTGIPSPAKYAFNSEMGISPK